MLNGVMSGGFGGDREGRSTHRDDIFIVVPQ